MHHQTLFHEIGGHAVERGVESLDAALPVDPVLHLETPEAAGEGHDRNRPPAQRSVVNIGGVDDLRDLVRRPLFSEQGAD